MRENKNSEVKFCISYRSLVDMKREEGKEFNGTIRYSRIGLTLTLLLAAHSIAVVQAAAASSSSLLLAAIACNHSRYKQATS